MSHARLGGVLDRNVTPVPQTGQVGAITYTAQGAGVQSFDYQYDVYGNVVRQLLNAFGTATALAQEDFEYDTLHRLIRTQRSGAATGSVNYRYTANGNVASKSDYGSGNYVYGAATGARAMPGPDRTRCAACRLPRARGT